MVHRGRDRDITALPCRPRMFRVDSEHWTLSTTTMGIVFCGQTLNLHCGDIKFFFLLNDQEFELKGMF